MSGKESMTTNRKKNQLNKQTKLKKNPTPKHLEVRTFVFCGGLFCGEVDSNSTTQN